MGIRKWMFSTVSKRISLPTAYVKLLVSKALVSSPTVWFSSQHWTAREITIGASQKFEFDKSLMSCISKSALFKERVRSYR